MQDLLCYRPKACTHAIYWHEKKSSTEHSLSEENSRSNKLKVFSFQNRGNIKGQIFQITLPTRQIL